MRKNIGAKSYVLPQPVFIMQRMTKMEFRMPWLLHGVVLVMKMKFQSH